MMLDLRMNGVIDLYSKTNKRVSLKEWDRLKAGFCGLREESDEDLTSTDDSAVSISWSSSSSNSGEEFNRTPSAHRISRHVITRLNFDDCVIQKHKTPRQKRARVKRIITTSHVNDLKALGDTSLCHTELQKQDSDHNSRQGLKKIKSVNSVGDNLVVRCGDVSVLNTENEGQLHDDNFVPRSEGVHVQFDLNVQHPGTVHEDCGCNEEAVNQKTPTKLNENVSLHLSPIIGSAKRNNFLKGRFSEQLPAFFNEQGEEKATSPIIGSSKTFKLESVSPVTGLCRNPSSHIKETLKTSPTCGNAEHYPVENSLPSDPLPADLPSPVVGSSKKLKGRKRLLSAKRRKSHQKYFEDDTCSHRYLPDLNISDSLHDTEGKVKVQPSHTPPTPLPSNHPVEIKDLEKWSLHCKVECSNNRHAEIGVSQNMNFNSSATFLPSSIPLSPVLEQKKLVKKKRKRKRKSHAIIRNNLSLFGNSSQFFCSRSESCMTSKNMADKFLDKLCKTSPDTHNKENESWTPGGRIEESVLVLDNNSRAFSKNTNPCLGEEDFGDKLLNIPSNLNNAKQNSFHENVSVSKSLLGTNSLFKIPLIEEIQHIPVNQKEDIGNIQNKNEVSMKCNIETVTQGSDVLHISFETQTLHMDINKAQLPYQAIKDVSEQLIDCNATLYIHDASSFIDSTQTKPLVPDILVSSHQDESEEIEQTNVGMILNVPSLSPGIETISSQETYLHPAVEQKGGNLSELPSSGRTSSCEQDDVVISSANASQENDQPELQSPPRMCKPLLDMDSAKKRRKRFKKGGLADRLQKLLNRQRSNKNMWQHELKSVAGRSQNGSLFIVSKVWVEFGRILILCYPFSDVPEQQNNQAAETQPDGSEVQQKSCSPGFGEEEELGPSWAVVLDPDILPLGQLRHGSTFRLYPPWQTLWIERMNLNVILSVTHAVLVSAGTPKKMVPQPLKIISIQEFGCPCTKGSTLPQNCDFELPRQGLDLVELLFPMRKPTDQAKTSDCHLFAVGGEASEQYGTIAEAITKHNHALVGNIWVQLRILRIFCFSQVSNTSVSQVDKVVTEEFSHNLTWSVLGKDSTAECCEVILGSPPSNCSEIQGEWNNIMTGAAVGSTYKFTGLTVIKKISGDVAAGLLNVEEEKKCFIPQKFLYVLSVASKQWEMIHIKSGFPALQPNVIPPQIQPLIEVIKQVDGSNTTRHTVLAKLLADIDGYLYITDSSLCSAESTRETPVYISIAVKPACVIPLRVSARMANVIYLQDLQFYNGQLYADKYSRIFAARDISSKTADEKFTFAVDGTLYSSISCLQPIIGHLQKSSRVHELVTVTGCVTHVDEETAFAWPACGKCDNDLLCEVDESIYLCQSCSGPAQVYTKMSLEVFVSCPGLPHHYQIRVKLQQSSISSLLPSTQNDGKGYEMSSVLNKDVGPLHCVVLKARTIPCGNGEEESMQFTLQEIPSWECKLKLQLQEINDMFCAH